MRQLYSFFFLFLIFSRTLIIAQDNNQFSGYVMYSPLGEHNTYLINPEGGIHHVWECSARPASTAHLLPDGSILRPYKVDNPTMIAGATGGGMQRIDWEGNVLWDFTWSEENHQQHHECIPIAQDDGTYNALIISWERKTNLEAIQAGRQDVDGEMWPTEIIEIKPDGLTGGTVVWEWHFWDHLCQDIDPERDNYYADGCHNHPELFDINKVDINVGFQGNGGDWIHANGIDYSPELNQIVFSSHYAHEIYVIDRGTTTEEAASHEGGAANSGGDFLYRWGNPQNYGAGTEDDQILYVVHGANFIDAGYPGEGNILVFNNGDRPGLSNDYSSVEEIIPSKNYALPWNQDQHWIYSNGSSFYSNHLSGAFRLPNGNTLATEGTSCRITEVNPDGEVVFQYTHSGSGNQNNVAKATFYSDQYEGIIDIHTSILEKKDQSVYIYPNPAQNYLNIKSESNAKVVILDVAGRVVLKHSGQSSVQRIDLRNLKEGVYFVKTMTEKDLTIQKLVVR